MLGPRLALSIKLSKGDSTGEWKSKMVKSPKKSSRWKEALRWFGGSQQGHYMEDLGDLGVLWDRLNSVLCTHTNQTRR